MRESKTLSRLRGDRVARICALGHFIPPYVCHAARAGFDCIWLDLEHRCFQAREVQALLAFCHQYDIDAMVRPPTLEKSRLYRYLEDGATGLLIPHVSTPEKAATLAQSVKFPPVGDRGLDGAGYDSDFLNHPFAEYVDHANRATFLVVQIETPQAVENAADIAAVDGVDGLFIGPGDLGLRLERSRSEMTLDDARARVAEAASKHGKAWGCPAATVEQIRSFSSEGARLLAHGGDFLAMMQMLQQSAADFESALETG